MDLSPDEDAFQGRLLHQAALWDNVELLQELIASGADVNARDEHGRTALHAAALAERSRCLHALVAAGGDADVVSDAGTGGKTALHIAAERGHVENIRTLLRASTCLHALDGEGHSALALAESNGHRHAVLALRDAIDAEERERLSQHSTLRQLCTRGEHAALRAQLAALGPAAGVVVNLTPAGANTLLYVASEAGHTASVSALLAAGADGRAHVVTHYSPLYIAAYHGHADIVNMLLLHFPHSVQQETVEKWLPLHAASIGGHAAIVTTLLEHPYPPAMLKTYTDPTGKWQYRMAFDVNARDMSGQSALYAACSLGHLPVVDALLSFTVPAVPAQDDQPIEPAPPTVVSPHRAGISLGIHAIVNKLTGNSKKESSEHRICPVRVECGRGADSCVSVAARGGHARVLRALLKAGADPDAAHDPPSNQEEERSVRRRSRSASAVPRTSPSPGRYNNDDEAPWTALAIAARAANVQIVEMLLAHGATDPHCRALRECVRHGLTDLVCSLLATKAYPDPEHKLNKSLLSESVFSGRDDNSLTYSALCPTTPVMINWRELKCQLAQIRMSWVRAAALRVNSRLSSTGGAALHALTRVDVSNNDLRLLPAELFTLISLRYLNAAQNKLERLPSLSDPFEDELDSKGRKIKKSKKNRPEVYSAPVLQELYLQDNRLEELPPALFSLPSLSTLDVSNNKLRALPSAMWTAPALRDLNAALNHLKDLPAHPQHSPAAPAPAPPGESPHCSATPSITSQFSFTSKPWSRSPSIEHSETNSPNDDDVPVIQDRAGNAVCSSPRRPHWWRYSVEAPPPAAPPTARPPLQSLNLAHNQFSCVPVSLACLAPHLTRLNLAYNSLRSMSFVTSYPTSLRQLDLSHNEISCWPSLPQVENFSTTEGDPLACYCITPEGNSSNRGRPRSSGSVRSQLLNAACPAKRHLRLETLRTLILANNLLTRIQLTTDDDGNTPAPVPLSEQDDDDEWQGSCSQIRSRLLFPLLSMLDVSCNMLRSLPTGLHLLTNLAVLNISGNKDITELPPTMGLLTRLWNLSAAGCSLTDPVKTMLSGGRYRSMDVIGYLRSVLHEAKPYARCKLMLTGVQGIGKTSLLECLRQESAIQHRRKPTEHWAKRMGNKSSRRNMSTVGVDIGTWVYEKQRSTRGPVTFRTWDFGGQQEYYATHQYFLSRRSLYLVVWKVTAGRRGLATAIDWLRSIQARAPGAPVIMVATHYDQVANCNLPESESPESLQRLIRSSIMGAADADKLGLPRVLDSVEVSCSTRHNIRLLADIIYSVAFSVKPAGSKEPLLEQLVPASYLALEECVTSLAAELREPVLRHDDYKRLVTQYMQQRGLRMFRDAAELHQATMFLHENGVLLHYDDATLKELYFLKPQWLCDVLAHVVTVREINPFAANGIMKMEDLAHVLKASPMLARGEEASALGVSLLNKFELALAWDQRLLLVPPLLPQHEPSTPQLPLRSRSWSGATRMSSRPWPSGLVAQPDPTRGTDSPTLIQESPSITWSGRANGAALRRLLLVSYVPCGLWPRLITRLLADQTLAAQAGLMYSLPAETASDETLQSCMPLPWSWKLWRRGVRLCCGELTLFSLRELGPSCDSLLPHYNIEEPAHEYTDLRLRIKQEGSWCELDVSASACIELHLPAQVCVLRRADRSTIAGYQSISLEPNAEVLAKVLALVSDHVDLLLEDWYPSLGTRFVHTSEGRCLITRCVPCPSCLRDLMSPDHHPQPPPAEQAIAQAFRRLEVEGDHRPEEGRRARLSEDSRTSDQDSGVGNESNASSRLGSVEGAVNANSSRVAFGWTVEECILAACTGSYLHCGRHDVRLRDVAPDTLLLDVEECKRAKWDQISRGVVMGRGAFGTVTAGTWRRAGVELRVAVKALQPTAPHCHSDVAALQAYKAALSRWERDPLSSACRAYCGVRQELSILSGLRHPHVVPLVGVCAAPLALLLELAPQGALDSILRSYRGCGCRVGPRVCRALALQAARALEYLHAKRIVYRDLKSENVLVWSMPSPRDAAGAETSEQPLNVHIKLADYGISRLAPLSGTKGFGGTEGYMAPEIMRYNGEEEYNEKVDCFSFGMLLYEILTLRQPFEGHEAVKEAILDGARPALSPRELEYPVALLECLRRCWHGTPALRPAAAALVCVLAAPDSTTLLAAARAACANVAAATHVKQGDDTDYDWSGWEVWYGGDPGRTNTLLVERTNFTYAHTVRVPNDGNTSVQVTAICRVGGEMWLGDSVGRVLVYSISTCAMLWSCRVREAVGGAASAVSALVELPALNRVALALQCGRLFLVTSSQPEAGGSFVLTELGTATDLASLAVVTTPQGVEVWAGGAGLSVYSVCTGGVSGAETLPAAGRVALLAAGGTHVLVYCMPGVSVYGWCAASKQCVSRLDCSKLAPCSESLQTLAVDDQLPTTVTALCIANGSAYIGTAQGCIVVADAATLRPLTVFRPYEANLCAIVPLYPHPGSQGEVLLATLGDGYRPLLDRFAPAQSNNTQTYAGYHCLLWKTQHWLPD